MPDISDGKTVVSAYVPTKLYEDWQDHADQLDMSVSQFVIRMVSAGRKNIDVDEDLAKRIGQLKKENIELRKDQQKPGQQTVDDSVPSETAQAIRDENPLKFGSDEGIVRPEKFSGYYGSPDKDEFERRVADGETFVKPKIGDLEVMRLYLGLEEQLVAEEVGVNRETYYHWRNEGQRIGYESLGKAVTVLTDAWNDAQYRQTLVEKSEPPNPAHDGNSRVALLRHLCELSSIPFSARSQGTKFNKTELGYVYGALTGDYETLVHRPSRRELHNLIAEAMEIGGVNFGTGSGGRLTVENLLSIQERLMQQRFEHPVLDSIDRLQTPDPRPHALK
jgi:hypothetical protein